MKMAFKFENVYPETVATTPTTTISSVNDDVFNTTLIISTMTTLGYIESENENGEEEGMKLGSILEIVIGCTLTFAVVVLLLVTLVRKSRFVEEGGCNFLKFGDSEEKLKWMKVKQDYDTFEKEQNIKKEKKSSLSASMPSMNSLMNLFSRSKSEGDAKRLQQSPKNTLTIRSNSQFGQRSPAITRSVRHGSIPFTLPPMALGKSSSTSSGLVERVQPYHPRSYSENDTSISMDTGVFMAPGIQEEEDSFGALDYSESSESTFDQTSEKSSEAKLSSTGNFRNSLLGQIQPELYKYSEHEEHDLPPSQYGRIWFTLVYDAAVEALTVKVVKIRQLQGRGSNVPHDSFVKLFLLPDERMSQQTKVKRRTNNPRFNETFVFQVSENDIRERTLRLSVYDVDKRKVARHLLGHALVSLSDVELLSQGGDDMMWRDLDDRAHPGDSGASLGEINISLSYLPSLNRLTAVVLRARNLREIDLEATGVYVKVALTQGHQIIKTRKTAVKRGECDPNYNESFSFTITPKDIESSCLSINVITIGYQSGIRQLKTSFKNLVSTGKPNSEHKYGRVVVGSFMFCRGEQLLHWQEMLAQQRKTISKWHPLSEVATND
uniref:synaptotagmin-15-like isoform X1 n=1 Tax=Styela clava TaxID=7725 RepID=UPI0019394B69|nr:synaptotagmin-15-like isoform X1 [Styela clava]